MASRELQNRQGPIAWGQPFLAPTDWEAIKVCIERKWISQGPTVLAFEAWVARLSGREFCVAVSSGSSALLAALMALRVGPSHEVIIPAMAFIAVPNAVTLLGAIPVLADIDPRFGTITPEAVKSCFTSRTAAVIGIDYSGFANNWGELYSVCRSAGVPFIVDAASSFLATYRGKPAGSQGDLATFSFHAAKTITTGEGGAVVTDNPEVAERLRRIRNHGEAVGQKYLYDALGGNLRMTDIAAALGLSQIRRRRGILERRRALVRRYLTDDWLREAALPAYRDAAHESSAFTFTVRLPNRDMVQQRLSQAMIDTRAMWSPCVDRQPLYQTLPVRCSGRMEGARALSASCLSLPLHTGLRPRDVRRIVTVLEGAVRDLCGGQPSW